jgi:hypothetical protein
MADRPFNTNRGPLFMKEAADSRFANVLGGGAAKVAAHIVGGVGGLVEKAANQYSSTHPIPGPWNSAARSIGSTMKKWSEKADTKTKDTARTSPTSAGTPPAIVLAWPASSAAVA